MKHKGYLISGGIALVMILLLMISRGFFTADTAEARLLAASDAVSVVALMFVCVGALIWISSTGVFDMLGYALKKGAHALIPGRIGDPAIDFYEYKMAMKEKERHTPISILVVGLILLALSFVLIYFWYKVSGNLA